MLPKIVTLEEVLSHYEAYSLDASSYWMFEKCGQLKNENICLQFKRSDFPQCWSIWKESFHVESLQRSSRKNIFEILKQNEVSEDLVLNELKSNLLLQAASAHEFVKHARELLGEAEVNAGIESTERFVSELQALVELNLKETIDNKNNITKQEQKNTAKGFLRLV
jgi:hypothetical protein